MQNARTLILAGLTSTATLLTGCANNFQAYLGDRLLNPSSDLSSAGYKRVCGVEAERRDLECEQRAQNNEFSAGHCYPSTVQLFTLRPGVAYDPGLMLGLTPQKPLPAIQAPSWKAPTPIRKNPLPPKEPKRRISAEGEWSIALKE